MSGHIGNVDTTCPDLDERQDVEGLEANRFDREEIARQQSIYVVIEESSPCQGRLPVGNGQYVLPWLNKVKKGSKKSFCEGMGMTTSLSC